MKKAFFKKRVYTLMLAVIMVLATAVPAFAIENEANTWDWLNFRGNDENNGVVYFPELPEVPDPNEPKYNPPTGGDATLKWASKNGEGWAACPTPPIIKGNFIFTAQGTRMLKLNKDTGELISESPANDQLAGNVGYAMNNMVYVNGDTAADDMIIVQIGNGQIQAVNANTLATLWKTDTANGVGTGINGQTISPLTAKKIGNTTYVYTGTWGGESSAYYCVTADMQNVNQSTKTKEVLWKHKDEGVTFYWAGAYVNTNYIAYGSDNGKLYTKNPTTGAGISEVAVNGQVRSTPVFVGDNTSGAGTLYFTTKTSPGSGSQGQLCKVSVASDGTLSDPVKVTLSGMATGTPIVHNGKVYVGVCGTSQFSPTSGHAFKVFNASTLAEVSTVSSPGYPQAAGLLAKIGTQNPYVYFTYNAPPGGMKVFQDNGAATQTASDLYLPDTDKQQYCISTIIADDKGTLYYKNDSCYIFAVTRVQEYTDEMLSGMQVTSSAGNVTLTPEFNTTKTEYKAKLPANATDVKFNLTLGQGATATIDGEAYVPGTTHTLSVPSFERNVTIKVTRAGTTKTYKVYACKNNKNPNLKTMTLKSPSGTELAVTPGLAPDVLDYEAAWTDSASILYVNLALYAEQSNANITVREIENASVQHTPYTPNWRIGFRASNVDAKVKIKVTVPGGISKEYTLKLPRALNQ